MNLQIFVMKNLVVIIIFISFQFTRILSYAQSNSVSSDTPLKINDEEAERDTINLLTYCNRYAFGFFGSDTYEPANGQVIHHVKGETIPNRYRSAKTN